MRGGTTLDWVTWPAVAAFAITVAGLLLGVVAVKATINIDFVEYLKYRDARKRSRIQEECDHSLVYSNIDTYCEKCDKTFSSEEATRVFQRQCEHKYEVFKEDEYSVEFICPACGQRVRNSRN